ncbi:hypothetical protein L1887_56011 [Cichorium endivia]|nr:hypothetical protein L1887_56011 [Cichorium endivia]
MLTGNTASGLGEPLNVIVSGQSDSGVLSQDGFEEFSRALYFSPGSCLNISQGGYQDRPTWAMATEPSRRPTSCATTSSRATAAPVSSRSRAATISATGSRTAPPANSGAIFIAASVELNATLNHAIAPNGYDDGRRPARRQRHRRHAHQPRWLPVHRQSAVVLAAAQRCVCEPDQPRHRHRRASSTCSPSASPRTAASERVAPRPLAAAPPATPQQSSAVSILTLDLRTSAVATLLAALCLHCSVTLTESAASRAIGDRCRDEDMVKARAVGDPQPSSVRQGVVASRRAENIANTERCVGRAARVPDQLDVQRGTQADMPTECSDRTMPVPPCDVGSRPSLQGGPRFSRGRQRVELGPTADKASTFVGTLKGVRAEAAPKSCVGLEMRTFACCRLLRSDEATRIHEVAPPSGSGRRVEMCTENWSVRQASCPLDGCLPSCRLSWAGLAPTPRNHGKCAGRACSRDSLPSAFAMPIPRWLGPVNAVPRTTSSSFLCWARHAPHGSLPATLIKAPQQPSHRRSCQSPYRFPPRAQTGELPNLLPCHVAMPATISGLDVAFPQDQNLHTFLFSNPLQNHPNRFADEYPNHTYDGAPIPQQRPVLVHDGTGAQLSWARLKADSLRPRSVPTGTHGPTARLCTQSQTSTRAHPCASYYRAHAHPQCPRELAYILAKARPQLLFTTVGAEGEVPLRKALQLLLDSPPSDLGQVKADEIRAWATELARDWDQAKAARLEKSNQIPFRRRRVWTVDISSGMDYYGTNFDRNGVASAHDPRDWTHLLLPPPGSKAEGSIASLDRPAFTPAPMTPEEQQRRIAFVLWSSGTTGQSKGVLISHRALVSNTLGIWDSNPHFSGPSRGSNGGGERWITLAPWYHVYG